MNDMVHETKDFTSLKLINSKIFYIYWLFDEKLVSWIKKLSCEFQIYILEQKSSDSALLRRMTQ